MKTIILFPCGTLTKTIKKQLETCDAIGIEVDDPSKIVMLLPSVQALSGDLFVKALVKSIQGTNSSQEREKFAFALLSGLIPAEQATKSK